MGNFDVIHDSPSQIYHYALPFCPPSSWLQEHYSGGLPQVVKFIRGAPAEWGTCLRETELGFVVGALSCRNNTIAVGFDSGDITFLNAVTGSQTAILHGHTKGVQCLEFSLDGKLLVSGGEDETVMLWDVQTGGVIKAFDGYTSIVTSVSISKDCTRIASASHSEICLLDVQTGARNYITSMESGVDQVSFSLINPGHLLSISGGNIQKWDINGHAAGVIDSNFKTIPSLDCVLFAGCKGQDVRIQSFESEAIVAEFCTAQISPEYCCFSPDGKLVALSTSETIEVWQIVGSNPSFIETIPCLNHNHLTFSSPSCLVSGSAGGWAAAFWKIGDLSAEPSPKSTTLASAPIVSVSLQAKDGIAITSNSTGVLEIWDLLTGLYKTSFQSPATKHDLGDAKLVNGRLSFAWKTGYSLHIWDSVNGGPSTLEESFNTVFFMVSGDGSKVFCKTDIVIKVWSVWTKELVGEVALEHMDEHIDTFQAGGSRIWVRSKDLSTKGWDFGVPNSPPALLPNTPSERPRLDFIYGTRWQTGPCLIMDTVTGKEVFRLVGKYAYPWAVKWDGQYLVALYGYTNEVLILDFSHLCPQ